MATHAASISGSRRAATSEASMAAGLVVLVGRFLFAAIFLMSGLAHFSSQSIGYASKVGVPMAEFLVPASGLMAALGGLSILLGYRARLGAWLLVLFLIPVTLTMHNFWAMKDPMM